jgi:microsomal dipeptidase-like Zn-dependent dipeptidase
MKSFNWPFNIDRNGGQASRLPKPRSNPVVAPSTPGRRDACPAFVVLLVFAALLLHSRAFAQINRCISITCPPDQTVECASPQGTAVTFHPTAQTLCGSLAGVVCTPSSGSVFPPGTNTVACVATDSLGNTARCEFKVVVRDTTPPSIAAPVQVTAECESPLGARVEFGVGVWDNCDPAPQVFLNPPSGSLFPIGITPVQCVAIDAAGNSSTNSFTVNISGDCCIQIACPPDIEATLGAFFRAGEEPTVRVDYDVLATNLCTGSNVLVYCTPRSGSPFSLGTHWVNCLVLGEEAACTFKVVVKDVTPPKLTVPRTMNVLCTETLFDGTQAAPVTFLIKATDNANANPTVTCTPPSGSYFRVGSNQVVCVARDASGNATTNSFGINVWWSQACVETPLEQMPDNWGFELGLTAWEAEGDAFVDQPVTGDVIPVRRVSELKQRLEDKIGGNYWHDLTYPVGHQGQHWVGTAENVSNLPGGLFDTSETEERTGTLRSKSFIIEKPFISFLIGGGTDDNLLRVELLTEAEAPGPSTVAYNGLPYEVHAYETGHNRESMHWVSWGVNSQKGKRAIIRILDHSATGHLNVDDFRFEDLNFPGQRVTIGGKEYPAWITFESKIYRWDSPVWGFADLHAHPMSHLGFGGLLMHGAPDGDIAEALGSCACQHGDAFGGCGHLMRQIVVAATDDRGPAAHYDGYTPGDPVRQFNSWPLFSSKLHQQMWHTWMRRAYYGGQRVIVALCVNNPLLATATKGTGPHDDLAVGNLQITELTNFVARHSDFMEIAYDPFQLRDIVRRDKLAIIIGSELDDIGNFARNNSVNPQSPSEADMVKVRDEIKRLYDLGLRYIFPVHLVNNSFGGTAIAGDMLNVANKYQNHHAFEVETNAALYQSESTNDTVGVYLSHLDFTADLIKVFVPWEIVQTVVDSLHKTEEKVGAAVGAHIGGGLYPIALLGASGFLSFVGLELNSAGIPSEIIPLNGNYPAYLQTNEWKYGHRNKTGLTPLGKFAIREMMKLGIIIDIDHMSEKAVAEVLEMAEQNPVGYPLNSGHNSPRVLGHEHERGENSRPLRQIERVRDLGGIFGVGFENGQCHSFDLHWGEQEFSRSKVENDCAGTSKTFAQYYLYTLEAMRGRGVALGTDLNGLIAGPGPRFGPQSAFGLGADPHHQRQYQVAAQENGVRYPEAIERPLTTPAFLGNAIDPEKDEFDARGELGYSYNRAQGDFFAAIRLYYWLKEEVEFGLNEDQVLQYLQQAVNALHVSYPNPNRVRDYAMGLLKGIHNSEPNGPYETRGYQVYRAEVKGQTFPPAVYNSDHLIACTVVWYRYHAAFGNNAPLKPCETDYKRWDINFEGVAHYGLLPDFFQDLKNVGLESQDMSVLFKSAEHFAQMWTKTIDAAQWAGVRIFEVKPQLLQNGALESLLFGYTTDGDTYELEESDDLRPGSWHPARMEEIRRDGNRHFVRVPADGPVRFFRLRKR